MKPIYAVIDGDSSTGSNSGPQEYESGAAPALLQNWQIVLRWKWVIGAILLGSLAVGVLVTLLMVPKYAATVRVEISREQKNITKVEGVDPTDARQDLEFYETQYSLLKSRSLAERVVRDLRLATRDEFFAAHGVNPSSEDVGSALQRQQRREKLAADLLLRHVNITPIRQSSLVDVRYISGSPTLSAEIANSWVHQFIQATIDRRFESTADARKFLEGRLSDLRTRVERSERDAVNYASQRGIVMLNRGESSEGGGGAQTLVSADLEALNESLSKAIADRVAMESRVRQGNAQGAAAEALSNPAIAQLRQRRAEAAAEYSKLLVQFEPEYPEAKALSEQVRALDASIAREEKRVGAGLQLEYQQALQREQKLRNSVEELKANLEGEQRNSIQYNIYQREADTNRQLYNALLQRYKEIGVAGVGANNISIVDPAKVPDNPTSPNLVLNLALALLTGVALAAAVTFIINQIDESIHEPSQVSAALKIPLLGSVPEVTDESAIALLSDVKSVVSEAYLTVRSNLSFSTDHGIPKTFLVTSTRAAEGKSTSCFALAVMLGRTGKKVILVDADLRSPSVHEIANVSGASGLSNILAGANDLSAHLRGTNYQGLTVLPAGPVPPSAAELLSGDRLIGLIKQLAEMFDHVVIDSPPILGLADAPLLSRAVEGCVFVVQAEGVAIRGVQAALNRLHAVNAHVYGAVLTKVKSHRVGYGYGYDYGYGYGRDSKQQAG